MAGRDLIDVRSRPRIAYPIDFYIGDPAMPARSCRIAGMGGYLPERVVTNHELSKYFDTSDDWIVQRTGIHERRYSSPGEGTASMGAEAARRAVADAGWKLADVEFIIFATVTPDHFFPGPGCYMQTMLGLRGIGALDVRNQCSGFLYALTVADALIVAGQYSRVLLVASETHSGCLADPKAPRDLAVLFGDGAAAVALEAHDGEGILSSVLHADGRGADALKLDLFDFSQKPYITAADLEAGKQYPTMDGKLVFRNAVEGMVGAAHETLAKAGKALDEIDLIITHQANLRIGEAVRARLALPPEKMFNNIQNRGNLTAASIPMALVDAREASVLERGQLVLLLAFGSGFTWGGTLLRY
jgi:3-oxoacyl-[acyl-carrier-protein] synthase-3